MSRSLLGSSQDHIDELHQVPAYCKHTGLTGGNEKTNYISSLGDVASNTLDANDFVIWPALLRIVDSEGVRVAEGDRELTEKVTLGNFVTVV